MEETTPASAFGSNDEPLTDEEIPADQITDRKRKRSSQRISCELCKARKVRCDRAEPACSWCARHNRQCVYKERQKPGIRVGYGLELEAKIHHLDAMLQVLGRRVEDHIQSHDVRYTSSLSPGLSQQSARVATCDNPARMPSIGSGDHTEASLPHSLWQSTNVRGETRTMNTPEGLSVHASVSVPGFESFVHPETPTTIAYGPQIVREGAYLSTDPHLLPSDILYTLVDLYFKHVNTWCPILDRKATFTAFFGTTSLKKADRILLHAIVSTTLRFLNDPRLTAEAKRHYHDVSKREVEIYSLEHVSIEALKALVILSLDVLGSSNGPGGRNLLALVAQNIIQLDLCVETNIFLSAPAAPAIWSVRTVALSQPNSWIEDEGRRRLCWMGYILDRYATVATSFDFMLSDKEMNRALPCRYDLFSKNEPVETRSFHWADRSIPGDLLNKPENLGSFSYHCEVLRILSRIHNFLREPINIDSINDVQQWRAHYRALDGELNFWLNGVPGEYGKISQLCHSDPASRVANWIMLHAAFVTSVIRLHSSAAYPTVFSPNFMPSYYAMQRCLSAVESLGDIAQDVMDTKGLDLLGPPFAFSLWSSARLLLVHAATMACEVDPKIDFFISTLRYMGQYWEVADNYAEILTRIVKEDQSGIMTFTAMRRRAYDLTLLTSSRRRTILEPVATRHISSNELEYIDIFDFFNYPRLVAGTHDTGNPTRSCNFAIPNPESDWLRFQPPHE